ncbi:IucA/IucC family siderophore biosynthesis protein [Salipaludibacillus neizhouensis]|uniref:IucA/IucC family siderophore biosynthesis protein n=1 Tax=Salipaludibacillus neizhouensis TaxID=885475 RepID=A0A3A9K9E4_9BACI|nr:IucA/IucC family siderophore biosynthesis protein [Salipaludibacillus neizhouensis]RKL68148.1 IucA/IucC family siderophore biosynthesis protein [Salipaludibacillus neizhouensis]
MNSKQIAEQATIQSFLNCYLRETGDYKLEKDNSLCDLVSRLADRKEVKQLIDCELSNQDIHLYIPLRYWSITGRHIFSFPLFYSLSSDSNQLFELDYVTLTSMVIKELNMNAGAASNGTGYQDELMMRVILSCQNIENFVRARSNEADHLYQSDMNFIESEQALIFGHLLHPTPKSRQGISEWDAPFYSPELKGKFQLHYFRVHISIVEHGSALENTAIKLVKEQLKEDPQITSEFKANYCQVDEYALIPIHPWQAAFLMRKPHVKALMEQGLIESIGKQGRPFYPTSSVRTVYHPEEKYMWKLSLNVKITNSIRANKRMELERGVEVKKLLDGKIGEDLRNNHPHFQIISDPAFLTVAIDGEKESGFEVILRENPFYLERALNATSVAALCQDSIDGHSSRLAEIIKELAVKEERSTEEVSLDWFRCYLGRSLKPIMWLYLTYGIALEAHQQNSVIQLAEGYPDRFYYRDNQGYYYCQSYHERLNRLLPGISEKSNTVCTDAIADERLLYYFYYNHLLGLVNAFGVSNLIEEKKLLFEIKEALEQIELPVETSSQLINSILTYETLPCKANLLTRFHDMDELTGSLETQSVYVDIDNPLVEKELDTIEAY